MEKDALTKIILQDIRELDTLLNTFIGKPEIPKTFIQLSRNKVKGLLDEIDLLEFILDKPESNEKIEIPVPEVIIPVKEEILEKPEEKRKKTVKQATPTKTASEKDSSSSITLGEKLMQGSHSFYDTLAQKETSTAPLFQNRPVKDIKSAIGINDRFYYQRELFGGDADLFNSTIDKLNIMNDIESAEALLSANFKWDEKNEAVQSFKDIVRRRYLR